MMSASTVIETATQQLSGRDLGVERLKIGLERDLGAVCLASLKDPLVVEIMLNADGKIWIEKLGVGMVNTGATMLASQAHKLMTNIATQLGTIVNADNPILEGELPLDGSRFEGIIPPVVENPIFAIRKRASLVFTLDEYKTGQILTNKDDPRNLQREKPLEFVEQVKDMDHHDIIVSAIKNRKNILVVGSTGSGKTTFVNAIVDGISKITPHHRIVLIEDTGEIQCNAKNFIQLRSNEQVGMNRLLRATLRLRPDRILVGEVRGGEALSLLKSWNTGHAGGVATLHANDCEAGLIRLEQLIQEAVEVVSPTLIAEAVDLVIFIDKDITIKGGRKVREVCVVDGYDLIKKKYILHKI